MQNVSFCMHGLRGKQMRGFVKESSTNICPSTWWKIRSETLLWARIFLRVDRNYPENDVKKVCLNVERFVAINIRSTPPIMVTTISHRFTKS